MEFRIIELDNKKKNYFNIRNDKKCLEELKQVNTKVFVKIGFNSLNLGQKLYGASKSESKKIQRDNCKYILSYYKILKKAIKILIKKNLFYGEIYVNKLSQKLNNNDIILEGLLNLDFNTKHFGRMRVAYEYACSFLDKENSLNNMCDFHDNLCRKHREKNIDMATGCCPNFCKLRVAGSPCAHKNLSCKIFMCDYLIDNAGFYFTPNTIPVLKKTFLPLERAMMFGMLCKTEKKSIKKLWRIRIFSILILIFSIFLIFTYFPFK